MASTLQVILQSDVAKLGKSGELVRVKPGFARNYLIPRGFATSATAASVNRLAHEKGIALAKAEKIKKEATATAAKLEGTVVRLSLRVGEGDRTFGAITAKEIEAALKTSGFTLEKKSLQLAEPIKTLGTHSVAVKLHPEVSANIKVDVTASK